MDLWPDDDVSLDSDQDETPESPTVEQILAGETDRGTQLGEEDWQGHFAEELLDTYYDLKDLSETRGFPIFDKLNFAQFCEFAYQHSSKYASS